MGTGDELEATIAGVASAAAIAPVVVLPGMAHAEGAVPTAGAFIRHVVEIMLENHRFGGLFDNFREGDGVLNV